MSDEQATARPWTLEVSTEGDDGMMVTISEIEHQTCVPDNLMPGARIGYRQAARAIEDAIREGKPPE